MPTDSKSKETNPSSPYADAWVLPAALRQLQECGETDLVEELIDIFQTDTASRLDVLAHAVEAADYNVARQEAHTVKGSALQVGALRFADACRLVEMEARKPEPTDLATLFHVVLRSFDEVRGVLAARHGSGENGSPHNGK